MESRWGARVTHNGVQTAGACMGNAGGVEQQDLPAVCKCPVPVDPIPWQTCGQRPSAIGKGKPSWG